MIKFMLIYWGSYVYFPVAIAAAGVIWKGSLRLKLAALCVLLASSALAYARFVEPRLLQVEEASIDLSGGAERTAEARIAIVADTHYGVFRNAMPMRRIVNRLKALDVDAVFLAGDISYYPAKGSMPEHLKALSALDVPVFAVLGNHDVGFPGPDLSMPVSGALQAHGAKLIENRALEIELSGAKVVVAGASDLWQRKYSFDSRSNLREDVPVLLLVHNPDMAMAVPDGFHYDLMLAGHTHGGQIRLPFFYKRAIPTEWPFDIGLHRFPTEAGERLVYVSPGTGMVGLPMRFLMPPRIDVLTLTLPVVAEQQPSRTLSSKSALPSSL